MISIIGLFPLQGNGGIASWTKKFLSTFPDENHALMPIDIAPEKDFSKFHGADRFKYGWEAYYRIKRDVKRTLAEHPDFQIMHLTTSGGYGVFRDHTIARICKKHGIKTVMHCRFGTIKELYEGKGVVSYFFRKNIALYDNIWVLDRRSANFLQSIPVLKEKIKLTPNSIEVPEIESIPPKTYKRVGFVGNILRTKGVFELVEAVTSLANDTELYVVGIGNDEDIAEIKRIAGDKTDKAIHLLGRLPNAEAVKLMETLDIVCLPTYYPGEAFPISILEAMSRGKMVISCPRAAIPDMLTALDGSLCGKLVSEKSASEIAEAIIWCQEHKEESDEMCRKAYAKVKTCYSKEVVYDIYRENYRKLLE